MNDYFLSLHMIVTSLVWYDHSEIKTFMKNLANEENQ